MAKFFSVHSIVAVVVLAIAFSGCKKEDMLSLDDEEFIFEYAAETMKTTVITNVRWTAIATADWITLSPAEGKITARMSISVSENTGGSERSADVIVTQVGGEGLSDTLKVIQAAK